MFDFTFLTKEQVIGENKLDLFKKYKYVPKATDFAILTGIMQCSSGGANYSSGLWWTLSQAYNRHDKVWSIGSQLHEDARDTDIRYLGVRPSIAYSAIKSQCTICKELKKGIYEVEFGSYPQSVPSEYITKNLDYAYKTGTLKQTLKTYTCKPDEIERRDLCGRTREINEYEYNGEKYVRFECKELHLYAHFHGKWHISPGDVYWLKVEPIKWLVDEKNDIALSKDLLFSGVEFSRKNYFGDFSKTEIKRFMNDYFAKEIMPLEELVNEEDNKIEDWIIWSSENMIHPLIHTFMIVTDGKYIDSECDWIEISNQLYRTDDLSSLQNILDTNIYDELCNTYVPISNIINDILENKMSDSDISNLSKLNKYLLITFTLLLNDGELANTIINRLEKQYIEYYEELHKQYNIKREELLNKLILSL